MESKVVSNLINAMRAVTVAIVVTCLVEASGQRSSSGSVKAWSSTNGSYGKVWHLSIQPDDSAIVSDSSELGAKSSARRFKISTAQREAILRTAEEAQFLALPDSLGPSLVPIHGPENTLEIELRGRVHKVFLNDPASAKGPHVERFRRVWRAVVETSPLKPPL
jgi:hypothetical protein